MAESTAPTGASWDRANQFIEKYCGMAATYESAGPICLCDRMNRDHKVLRHASHYLPLAAGWASGCSPNRAMADEHARRAAETARVAYEQRWGEVPWGRHELSVRWTSAGVTAEYTVRPEDCQ